MNHLIWLDELESSLDKKLPESSANLWQQKLKNGTKPPEGKRVEITILLLDDNTCDMFASELHLRPSPLEQELWIDLLSFFCSLETTKPSLAMLTDSTVIEECCPRRNAESWMGHLIFIMPSPQTNFTIFSLRTKKGRWLFLQLLPDENLINKKQEKNKHGGMPPPPTIWNPDAVLPSSIRVRPFHYDALKHTQRRKKPSPEQEAARMAALKRLRHKLVTLCSSHKPPPTLSMERWISRAALARDVKGSTTCVDPILPSSGIADPGMTKDLARSMGFEQAQAIAETMAIDSKAAADRISKLDNSTNSRISGANLLIVREELRMRAKAVKRTSKAVQKALKDTKDKMGVIGGDDANSEQQEEENKDTNMTPSLQTSLQALQQATSDLDTCRQKVQRIADVESGNNIMLNTSRRPGICDVMLLQSDGSPKKPYHTISIPHLTKAVQLWQLHNPSCSTQSTKSIQQTRPVLITAKEMFQNAIGAIDGLDDASDFLKHLYCCLTRYETIKGAGYQCAVPPVAFEAAHNELGLGMTVECFASPFNCRYREYCSAFPDLERSFGSLGSFFDDDSFFPSHGSFEANPPFVPETMHAMSSKLERILNHPKAAALSFLVIVPVWGASGTDYVDGLESSTFCVAKARILAADHSFCDGSQHKAMRQELRPSSWDTAIILLQNEAGKKEWPVLQEQLDKVFGSALKSTKGKSSLGDWERRGVGQGGRKRKHQQSHQISQDYTKRSFINSPSPSSYGGKRKKI
eukprot:scaffold3297_cov132-Cylindrotheca_fusiformis.AAC.4